MSVAWTIICIAFGAAVVSVAAAALSARYYRRTRNAIDKALKGDGG